MRGRLPILAACVTVSGAAGLAYEVVWSRYIGLLIGSSTLAHTLVLAAFMGGLALGNALFGRFADRTPRPLFAYGLIELGIAALAVVFAVAWPGIAATYLAIGGALGPTSGGLFLVKLGLGALVLLPPTVLMGGTIPLLGRFLVDRDEDVGSRVALLYFVNTAGAVAGCGLAGFWWIEGYGLTGTLWIAAALNTLVGVSTLALSRQWESAALPGSDPDDASVSSDTPIPLRRAALVCVGITGGLTMVYELVWIRMVGFIFGSSSQSFSVMLVTFLAGIALGGAASHKILTSRWFASRRRLMALFGACELGVAASVLAMLPLYERFPYFFAQARTLLAPTDGGYLAMQALQILLLAAVMLIPTTLIGVTLPLASRVVVAGVDDVGAGVGASFASNTLGTLVGAAATGLILIPFLGVQLSLLVAIGGSAVVGGALLALAGQRRWGLASAVVAVALLVVVGVAGGAWNPVLMTAGYFRGKTAPTSFEAMQKRYAGHELLFARDGHDSTVTVVRVDGEVFLKVNGKTDASTLREDMVTQTISGHLPLLLHPGAPRKALVIGLGSGVTAGSVLTHPDTSVVSVELSQAVVDGARHFAHRNHDVLSDPDHELLVADAKDYVHLTPERFDVVVSEPSNPWISGVASLFTVEFFSAIRDVMTEDGVYLQWLQLYAFTDEVFSRSVRSLRAVFPHVTVWRFTRADCLLVASRTPLSTARLEARMAAVADEFGADSPLPLESPAQLLAHQVLSSEAVSSAFAPRPPLNVDAEPYLEFEAPRAMFRRTSPAILDDLDERRDPGATGRLLTPGGDPLGVAAALRRSGHDDLAKHVEASVAIDAEVSSQAVDDGLAKGDAVPALLHAIDRATEPSAQQCTGWSGRLAALAIDARNALHRPSLRRLERFVALCQGRHPELRAKLRRYLGKAFYATGSLEAARPLLAEP